MRLGRRWWGGSSSSRRWRWLEGRCVTFGRVCLQLLKRDGKNSMAVLQIHDACQHAEAAQDFQQAMPCFIVLHGCGSHVFLCN
jgi:hypothetical protein